MDAVRKRALLEPGLLRAAEALGDVTAPVMGAFYARYPEAKAAFERLALGNRARLEGEMVAQVLYCLMTWFEHPGEVTGVLMSSVPHHEQTLGVRPVWYEGLMACTCAILRVHATAVEHEAWRDVEARLCAVIRNAAC